MNKFFNSKDEFINEFKDRLKNKYLVTVEDSSDRMRYNILSSMIMDYSSDNWIESNKKIENRTSKEVFYFSMEFLLGRQTKSNINSLGIEDVIKEGFKELNIDLDSVLEKEKDPGLGNGGLGRLAACYFDSLSSLKYPAMGHTIRYRYGLFRQKIKNGYQEERPDDWLSDGFNYEIRKEEDAIEIPLYGYVSYDDGKIEYHPDEYIKAVPYDVPIIGYRNKMVNTLRLWNAEPGKKYPINKSAFDYENDIKNICGFLYPDDSSENGKRLRLVQQYFFSAAGINSICKNEKKKYGTLSNLDKHAILHLNDTHPAIIISELMRILLDEENMEWNDAFKITSNMVCYTNHTLLKEALEVWRADFIRSIIPRNMQIIDEINRRFVDGLYQKGYKKDFVDQVAIIKDGNVHMANLLVHTSFKVNGVAELHSSLLKNVTMKAFDYLYPNKFTNVTNGVTPRRWIMDSNPGLSSFLDKYAKGWRDDITKFKNLSKVIDNKDVLDEFIEIKHENKVRLANYINSHQKTLIHKVNPDFIFDVQVKRLHEYKRQLLNILHIMYLYDRLKSDIEYRNSFKPTCFIFGAKAASGYYFAKKVIKLINTVSKVIDQDEEMSKYLQVIFIENYSVSLSELIMPAVEVSEQISLASYEASGTGNMKAMMNGSITIGTLDGANVEIFDAVGKENMEIFGYTKDEVQSSKSLYNPRNFYEVVPIIKSTVDNLINGSLKTENKDEFREIYDKLVYSDPYMVLGDFMSYKKAQENVNEIYKDKYRFAKIELINTMNSYIFSSDRSIEEYAKNIWEIPKLD